jgi:hypothetical protein
MKEKPDSNWKQELVKALFNSVFITLLVFLSQNYLLKLWAPETAAETLKKENFITSKKETYYEAINLATRSFAMVTFDSVKVDHKFTRIRGTTYPNEYEVNSCLSKLYLYTDNIDIIYPFKRILNFRTGDKVDTLIYYQEKFLKNIKIDLSGNKSTSIDNYQYIMVNIDTTYK